MSQRDYVHSMISLPFTENSSYSKYSWFIFYILDNFRYILFT
nr:MAG TPA: hypothetical protein [Caudoviricetes sp.]